MTIIERDGKRFLAMHVSDSTFDGIDGFNTCLVEVTPEIVAGWRAKLEVAKKLKAEHGIDYFGMTDYAPEWRAGNFDEDPLDGEYGDVYQPDWTREPERTESDIVEYGEGWIEWHARPKHSNDEVTATFYARHDLDQFQRIMLGYETELRS